MYNYAAPLKLKSKVSKRKKKINILTIGHVTAIKNPELWFEIAARVMEMNQSVNFYWAGDGDLIEKMTHQVRNSKYKSRVFFLGQQEVQTLYEKCDIYFQPSSIESHGIAVVDAMYYSLPVVTSFVGGLPESVDNLVTGILHDVVDVEGFTKTILWLAENRAIREKFGIAGKKKCNKMFTKEVWESELTKYVENVSGNKAFNNF